MSVIINYAVPLLVGCALGKVAYVVIDAIRYEFKRRKAERQTLTALKRFSERLESGEEIPVKLVTREHTPDGPLTTIEQTTLNAAIERMREEE